MDKGCNLRETVAHAPAFLDGVGQEVCLMFGCGDGSLNLNDILKIVGDLSEIGESSSEGDTPTLRCPSNCFERSGCCAS